MLKLQSTGYFEQFFNCHIRPGNRPVGIMDAIEINIANKVRYCIDLEDFDIRLPNNQLRSVICGVILHTQIANSVKQY